MIFNQMPNFKNLFLLSIIAISIISVVFFLYRYESVTVNFFPQNSNLIYAGIFNNATSLAELGNTTYSLGLNNMSGVKSNISTVNLSSNNANNPIDDIVSLSNPVDTLTKMIINVLENSSIADSTKGKDLGLKKYYQLNGSWNLKIKGTGDLTLDDETIRVQLLLVLYKNENIYVVFASKTDENLFDNFLIHGDIMQRKFEY